MLVKALNPPPLTQDFGLRSKFGEACPECSAVDLVAPMIGDLESASIRCLRRNREVQSSNLWGRTNLFVFIFVYNSHLREDYLNIICPISFDIKWNLLIKGLNKSLMKNSPNEFKI